ncbi:MAG: LacI family DNA-binding transcriptional regulator [Gammaproteobacteria bacterium]|nr:LacI family DNA-binding transcriptional regulator [Gammaproteobacteria bacterium]NND53851.1 LacI family DNA-binding transcriptional regulator [Gammaproteobacteria bacterium]
MAKVTIDDVAKKAGVSIKTVSRVLNKESNVRQQTRERVQKAIDSLNYHPDPVARRLAGSRSYLIALLYDASSAGYVMDIQGGVLKTCQSENYELVIHPCDHLANVVPEVHNLIDHLGIDGILLTPPMCDMPELVMALQKKGIPFASIAPGDRQFASATVHTNDREVSAEMTSYLASLGHEKIGFIIGHPDHKAVGNRFAGYKEGLERSGLEFDASLTAQGFNTFESGVECGILLLRRENRPTAIFASNDEMAAGIMRVAHQLKLRVPEDLSVVGFDDLPVAKQMYPSLTTVRQPIRAMAETATRLLLGVLRGEAPDGAPLIPCRPQFRESTCRINGET